MAAARQSALQAQAAFRQQSMIDGLARAPQAVELRLFDGARRREIETTIPMPLVPGVFAGYAPARSDGPTSTRVQPVGGGDVLRGQTQR